MLDTAAYESHERWWRDAGVEQAIAERPVRWLDSDTRRARAASMQATPAPSAALADAAVQPSENPAPVEQAAPAWPEAFDALHGFLAAERRYPGGDYGSAPVLPLGAQGARLAIVTDMPSAGDVAAGQLFSGEEGQLLDAMLGAVGLNRADCYLMAIATSRPSTGELAERDHGGLADFARHHLSLADPEYLLILGEQASRIMLKAPMLRMRGRLRGFNVNGRELRSANCFHPRTLLARPAYKKQAWQDLQLLMKEMPQ